MSTSTALDANRQPVAGKDSQSNTPSAKEDLSPASGTELFSAILQFFGRIKIWLWSIEINILSNALNVVEVSWTKYIERS